MVVISSSSPPSIFLIYSLKLIGDRSKLESVKESLCSETVATVLKDSSLDSLPFKGFSMVMISMDFAGDSCLDGDICLDTDPRRGKRKGR